MYVTYILGGGGQLNYYYFDIWIKESKYLEYWYVYFVFIGIVNLFPYLIE